MVRAISECYEIDEVKDIRDKARAMEVYAQQAMNVDAERQAIEIRIRAERKVGQMLRDMDKNAGAAQPTRSSDTTTLEDMGISKDQSSKWQRLAAVPDDEFEQALADTDTRPTTAGIAKKAKEQPKPINSDALWLWGRIRECESRGLFNQDPEFLIDDLTPAMRDGLIDLLTPMKTLISALEEYLCQNNNRH